MSACQLVGDTTLWSRFLSRVFKFTSGAGVLDSSARRLVSVAFRRDRLTIRSSGRPGFARPPLSS